jgi:D-sedoheptulose 7-phosphate isomerase
VGAEGGSGGAAENIRVGTESCLTATDYTGSYLEEVRRLAGMLDRRAIDRMIRLLAETRERGGRVFLLGVGGGAANAIHAAADLRKIAGLECHTPGDNVAELTARINDDGWETCYAEWLRTNRPGPGDAVLVFSVGGGSLEPRISVNLVESLKVAREAGCRILGVVGRDGGYTAQVADACVVVPTASAETVTPHTEEFQGVVWHLMVSHPLLRRREMKWESAR